MAFIRKVKTASGATAVQIAHKAGGRIIKIEHIGSAHTDEELQILLEVARHRLQANQLPLFPEDQPSLQVSMKRSFSGLLWRILEEQYNQLGFTQLEDKVFEALCLARIVEPTSKLDSLRVLADLGVDGIKKTTLFPVLNTLAVMVSILCCTMSPPCILRFKKRILTESQG